jgi:hypothetical protein
MAKDFYVYEDYAVVWEQMFRDLGIASKKLRRTQEYF